MTLPPRLAKKPKRESRHCEHCDAELQRKSYEETRDWNRRRYCGKVCAMRGGSPYVSRHERLLSNSASADERGCWNWQGYRDKKGYGRCEDASGEVLAHRLSYMEFVGPIPSGLHILHSCDNPSCINPGHLRAGTNDDNMADRVERDRSHKPKGVLNCKAKLTDDDVRTIRASGLSRAELSLIYGVAPTSISNIRLRRTWQHV